ncbi:hypothetical protein SAY86_006247 [Trapa natans]|uniref:Uncharacterized protein n=1 Tax=Trapa natans TaxID=22666 RepID=A0AAN7L690_TRANT|nr:hypothetical protein SAY86_006247 [Trapa natans]
MRVETSAPLLDDSFRPRRFLTNDDFEKIRFLEDYSSSSELKLGWLTIKVIRKKEMDEMVSLLVDSFMYSMVKQYLIERRGRMPSGVTFLEFSREKTEFTHSNYS